MKIGYQIPKTPFIPVCIPDETTNFSKTILKSSEIEIDHFRAVFFTPIPMSFNNLKIIESNFPNATNDFPSSADFLLFKFFVAQSFVDLNTFKMAIISTDMRISAYVIARWLIDEKGLTVSQAIELLEKSLNQEESQLNIADKLKSMYSYEGTPVYFNETNLPSVFDKKFFQQYQPNATFQEEKSFSANFDDDSDDIYNDSPKGLLIETITKRAMDSTQETDRSQYYIIEEPNKEIRTEVEQSTQEKELDLDQLQKALRLRIERSNLRRISDISQLNKDAKSNLDQSNNEIYTGIDNNKDYSDDEVSNHNKSKPQNSDLFMEDDDGEIEHRTISNSNETSYFSKYTNLPPPPPPTTFEAIRPPTIPVMRPTDTQLYSMHHPGPPFRYDDSPHQRYPQRMDHRDYYRYNQTEIIPQPYPLDSGIQNTEWDYQSPFPPPVDFFHQPSFNSRPSEINHFSPPEVGARSPNLRFNQYHSPLEPISPPIRFSQLPNIEPPPPEPIQPQMMYNQHSPNISPQSSRGRYGPISPNSKFSPMPMKDTENDFNNQYQSRQNDIDIKNSFDTYKTSRL